VSAEGIRRQTKFSEIYLRILGIENSEGHRYGCSFHQIS